MTPTEPQENLMKLDVCPRCGAFTMIRMEYPRICHKCMVEWFEPWLQEQYEIEDEYHRQQMAHYERMVAAGEI